MQSSTLFSAISEKADLDNPAEQFLAQRFRIGALFRVSEQLPDVAQAAPSVANRFMTGVASAEEVIGERVKLWKGGGLDMTELRLTAENKYGISSHL